MAKEIKGLLRSIVENKHKEDSSMKRRIHLMNGVTAEELLMRYNTIMANSIVKVLDHLNDEVDSIDPENLVNYVIKYLNENNGEI